MVRADKQTRDLAQILGGYLSQLTAQSISPTPTELVLLMRACERLQRPSGAEDYPAAGRPFRAGDVWLWPFTMQASRWYSRVADWFDAELERAVLAFALAHGRRHGIFCYLDTFAKAHAAVSEFADELGATVGELDVAIAACLAQLPGHGADTDEDEDDPFQAYDSGGVDTTALLQMNFGQTAEYWESSVSVRYVNDALRTVAVQADATGDRMRKIPQQEATGDMGRLMFEIEAAHAAEVAA